MSLVVVHTSAGEILKGTTNNFVPNKDRFHLLPAEPAQGARPIEILINHCKGVFFVKNLSGNPHYVERNEFDPNRQYSGRKIRIVFRDGEVMLGTTNAYHGGRPAFFVVPVDPESNNERCFVISSATNEITLL